MPSARAGKTIGKSHDVKSIIRHYLIFDINIFTYDITVLTT